MLWGSMFLTIAEIEEVLAHVKNVAPHPFVYPMFVFVAHTGARRSEMLRSMIDDFDFRAGVVRIREKKKDHAKTVTFRRVPMTKLLSTTMTEWFAQHPGGRYTICEQLHMARRKTAHRLRSSYHLGSNPFFQGNSCGQQVGQDPRLSYLPALLRLQPCGRQDRPAADRRMDGTPD